MVYILPTLVALNCVAAGFLAGSICMATYTDILIKRQRAALKKAQESK